MDLRTIPTSELLERVARAQAEKVVLHHQQAPEAYTYCEPVGSDVALCAELDRRIRSRATRRERLVRYFGEKKVALGYRLIDRPRRRIEDLIFRWMRHLQIGLAEEHDAPRESSSELLERESPGDLQDDQRLGRLAVRRLPAEERVPGLRRAEPYGEIRPRDRVEPIGAGGEKIARRRFRTSGLSGHYSERSTC